MALTAVHLVEAMVVSCLVATDPLRASSRPLDKQRYRRATAPGSGPESPIQVTGPTRGSRGRLDVGHTDFVRRHSGVDRDCRSTAHGATARSCVNAPSSSPGTLLPPRTS